MQTKKMINKYVSCILLLLIGLSMTGAAAAADMEKTCAEIRREALLSLKDGQGHPLPLAASWQTGMYKDGFGPDYQMDLIEKGHHLLPWFQLNGPDVYNIPFSYYESAIKKAARYHLPISFKSTQWESLLYIDPAYKKLPAAENPNVIESGTGKVRKQVSPFGPAQPWYDAGRKWTSQDELKTIQNWYPNPPLVIFLSNNEAGKLKWTKVEESKRYMDQYGSGRSGSFKSKVVGDGWIRLYNRCSSGDSR
ncbi:MAG: hypothetical protein D4R88_09070 [Methanosarcinales archaeon]|nr:MAG: hypothetical protein D4R88_09070 [Methanosarcinales archaeon]